MSEEPRICFVISPIGENGSPTRQRADILLNRIIGPVVSRYGYKAIRADFISQAGDITIQIIDMLIKADLVIADLTDHNANVFYELAIRHASRKPIIHVINTKQSPPFDVRQFRAIPYDVDNFVVTDECIHELDKQVAHFDQAQVPSVTNPIAIAIDIDLLSRSGNVAERSYASLVESVQKIESSIDEVYEGLYGVIEQVSGRLNAISKNSVVDISSYTEPYDSPDLYTGALQALSTSFNDLVEEARKEKESIPQSVLLRLSNVESYIRGLIFQAPIIEQYKMTLNRDLDNFYDD